MAQTSKKLNESDLNQASELLLAQLPDHISQLILIIKDENNINLWQLICGILLEVYSEGRISAFQIDPQWLDGLRQTTLVCKECRKVFTPVNINQPYCSEPCGTKADLRKMSEIFSNEPKEAKDVKHPIDIEPVVAKSASTGDNNGLDSGWSEILEDIK